MAWTNPPTVATGDLWTAAEQNTYLRDNENYLKQQIDEGYHPSNTSFPSSAPFGAIWFVNGKPYACMNTSGCTTSGDWEEVPAGAQAVRALFESSPPIFASDTDADNACNPCSVYFNSTLNVWRVKINGNWLSATVEDAAITTAKIADGAVTQSKLASASVSHDKLKIGNGYFSANIASSGWASVTLNEYSLLDHVYKAGGNFERLWLTSSNNSDYVPRRILHNTDSSTYTFYDYWHYITASRPPEKIIVHDLGGRVVGVWQSELEDFTNEPVVIRDKYGATQSKCVQVITTEDLSKYSLDDIRRMFDIKTAHDKEIAHFVDKHSYVRFHNKLPIMKLVRK